MFNLFENQEFQNPFAHGVSDLHALVHKADWERVAQRLKATIPSNPHASVLFRLDSAYARNVWLWLQVKGVFNDNRELVELCGTLTDVTSRKKSLDDLRINERFYEQILSTMPVQLVVFNEEHRYIYCNKTAISDDHTRNWIIGKDDFEYCRQRGKDINIAWQRRYYFQQALAYRQEIKWEEEIWKNNHNKVVSLRRLTPIYDDEGALQFVLGYGFDITDRRLAEEHAAEQEKLLKSINANIQDGIYRYSSEAGFLYVNDAFLRIFGCRSMEALNEEGRAFFERDGKERKALIDIQGMQGSFNNREVLFQGQHVKARFWGLISCNKKNDPNDGIVYDGVIADITELKEAEELLKKTNEELKQKNSDLDRFIYSASHDLRAPLTSIQGLLQLADLEEPYEATQHYLSLIRSSVDKLENFVNDLIDYYRNAKTQQSYHQIAFEELVKSCFANFKYMEGADRTSLSITNTMSEPLYSDQYRLRIVLSNLLSNAIKYQDFNKPNPYIKVQLSEEKEKVYLTISDNGVGIPEERVERVWEMFYQGGEDRQGSGMGLFIIRETVHKLGGHISIRSKKGEGSIFEIQLTK